MVLILNREYYWNKHEVVGDWTDQEPPEDAIILGEKDIYEIVEQPAHGRYYIEPDTTDGFGRPIFSADKVTLNYAITEQHYGDFITEEIARTGEAPTVNRTAWPAQFNFDPGEHLAGTSTWQDSPQKLYLVEGGNIIEHSIISLSIYDDLWDVSGFYRWFLILMNIRRVRRFVRQVVKTIWAYQARGPLIESVIAKDGTYPEDGVYDGFWWVKGDEYTLEPPELITPDPVAEIDEQVDLFELEIVPRETYNPGNYHVRLRVGPRSDFQRRLFFADTTQDLEGWEYYDGNNWQDFPAVGVDANTRVRYHVPVDVTWDFGMYFWDAQAYHSFWGYGPAAPHRSIILMVETDQVYMLYVRGVPYLATSLRTVETSNGRIGGIRMQLVNEI